MVNPSDLMLVVCPRCGKETKEEIGRLQGYTLFRCSNVVCNGWLQYNLNELNEFVRDELGNFGSKFRLKRYPEDTL